MRVLSSNVDELSRQKRNASVRAYYWRKRAPLPAEPS